MPQDASSALGQQIGALFDEAVLDLLHELSAPLGFDLMSPSEGKRLHHLTPIHGIPKQIDHIITAKGEADPLVVIELKWLKDSRHIYDKGGWIEGLAKVKQGNPTVRGALALLAGHWSPKIIQQLEFGGGVRAIVMLTVEEMYDLLRQFGVDIQIDKQRNAIVDPETALAQFRQLTETDRTQIKRQIVANQRLEVEKALENFLTPVDNLLVTSIEVVLKTNQGNVFIQEFASAEKAIQFISEYTGPDAEEKLRQAVKEKKCPYQLSLPQDN